MRRDKITERSYGQIDFEKNEYIKGISFYIDWKINCSKDKPPIKF